MARKRKELGPDTNAKICELLARGGTAGSIARALKASGVAVSEATVGRRILELRGGGGRSSPVAGDAPVAPALPASPEEIPEGADPETLDYWINLAREMGEQAHEAKNLDGFGKMGRLAASLLDAKRKSAPLPKPNPNDNPDLVKATERARARLHKLIDQVAV